MIVKDYKPIGHIDFIDGTRVPVVKEFETKNTSTREVVNFVAVDGEMYQFDKNKNKHEPSNCVCRFLKFNDKQCYFEPTDTIKEIEIYSPTISRIYSKIEKLPETICRLDYSKWVRTSPAPALIWPGDHSTMWVPNIKYENLKKDYTILANALKKLCPMLKVTVINDKTAKVEGFGIFSADIVCLLKEAFNIAEKDDTPEHTLRRMCYNIYNYNVLQKKYDVLLKENEKLKDELTVVEDANYVINKNIDELKQQYKALREKHDAVRKERYELSKEYEDLLKEYENITKFTVLPRIAMSSEECTELRKKNKDLENHLAAINADNEKHILTIAELKKEVSSLQQENRALVVSRNFYKSSKGTLEFSLRGQIAGLSIANGRLEAELAIAKDANHAIKEKCVELEKRNYSLNDELTYQKGKVDVLLQERQHYINKSKRYAETLSIIDSNLGWSPRRDNDGTPYYYASSLILAKDINKIKQTMQEVKSENN